MYIHRKVGDEPDAETRRNAVRGLVEAVNTIGVGLKENGLTLLQVCKPYIHRCIVTLCRRCLYADVWFVCMGSKLVVSFSPLSDPVRTGGVCDEYLSEMHRGL